MNKTEQAKQLRLAAKLIETGHPWELETVTDWHPSSKTLETPLHCIFHGQKIRLALATPPDGRPLHNPDNLTAEQVGVGWRLTLKGEKPTPGAQMWVDEDDINGPWEKRDFETRLYCAGTTYRLPLSVPWPEPETKTVPLGPEDVLPGSVFRHKGDDGYIAPTSVFNGGIYSHDEVVFLLNFQHLMSEFQINRSIPLTGKWDASAWEPCHKTLANG